MRAIGQLASEEQARVFGDHLVAHKIRNEIEPDGSAWVVWIKDEEQIVDAKARLERFRANPSAAEFQSARAQAAQVKAAEAEELANYRQRMRNRRSVFPKFGGYGIGALTYGLIALCVVVAILSKLGYDTEFIRKLVLADPDRADGTFLPEVRAGEYWRLLTPIFIHFGPLHLVFNLMWLFQLGCMIEARRGVSTLAALVIVTGVLPMVAQYLVSGPGFVGGMSGAVYGLAGFVWLRGRKDPASGVGLDPQSWIIIDLVGAEFYRSRGSDRQHGAFDGFDHRPDLGLGECIFRPSQAGVTARRRSNQGIAAHGGWRIGRITGRRKSGRLSEGEKELRQRRIQRAAVDLISWHWR